MKKVKKANLLFFLRLLFRSLSVRKKRVFLILLSLTAGVSVITSFYLVSYNIETKLARQMRKFGANLIQKPPEGKTFSFDEARAFLNRVPREELVGFRPVLYALGTLRLRDLNGTEKPVVIAGTSFSQIREVNPYWKIRGRLPAPEAGTKSRSEEPEILLGKTVAETLGLRPGQSFDLKAHSPGKNRSGDFRTFRISGILTAGGEEDNFIYPNIEKLRDMQNQGNRVSAVYYSLLSSFFKGKENPVPAVPGRKSEFVPITKIAGSESNLLSKVKTLSFFMTFFLLGVTLFSLTMTMFHMVDERQKEMALKKSLGASGADLLGEFAGEIVLYCLAGAVLGNLIGWGLAQLIGYSLFDQMMPFRPRILLFSFGLTSLVILTAALLPLKILGRIRPSVILKSE